VHLSSGFLGIGDDKHLSGGGSGENKELETARMATVLRLLLRGIKKYDSQRGT